MNANDQNPHPTRDALERYLDEDLGGRDRAEVEAHVTTCSGCRREVESYRAFFAELDRIPSPEPPAGFDLRVLAEVLPQKSSEILAVLRLAFGAYAALSVLLSVVASAIFILAGSARTERAIDFVVTRVVGSGLEAVRGFAVSCIDLLKAAGELLSVVGPAQTVVRGLETAATAAMSPQLMAVFALTLTLAALILFWALSSARERGVPHASLSL